MKQQFFLVLAVALGLATSPARADRWSRFDDVVRLVGDQFPALDGVPIDRLALLACAAPGCHAVPFQVDERDAEGRWVLEHGPQPNHDDPPGVLDANDLVLFMAADAGVRATAGQLSAAGPIAEISVRDPLTGATRWVYLAPFAGTAPRATQTYVSYDPATDRVSGARVRLGFVDGMPGYLAIGDGPNLLDRLKVRAAATFLFGLIHFSRSEADLRTQFMGWHAGPIRIIRAQRQWVRLGWGIHSPTFGSYTYFYRSAAELPVGLRLNFRPTYFFGNIVIRVVLDFRDLTGWSLELPSQKTPIAIDGRLTPQKRALNGAADEWFALHGPAITLVQTMGVSASLASVHRGLVYREGRGDAEPPEDVPGDTPGIGWQLDRWEHVGAGAHQLEATSYALPAGADVRDFMRARRAPVQVTVRPLR